MADIELGMDIEDSELQSINKPEVLLRTLPALGIVIEDIERQPSNEDIPKLVTVLGIDIDFSEPQYLNA